MRIGRVSFSLVDPASVNSPDRMRSSRLLCGLPSTSPPGGPPSLSGLAAAGHRASDGLRGEGSGAQARLQMALLLGDGTAGHRRPEATPPGWAVRCSIVVM